MSGTRIQHASTLATLSLAVFTAAIPLQALAAHAYHTLETVVVTSTREAKPALKVTEAITVLDKEAIETASPTHPAELLNRVPGVFVANVGGEGHMTAIRQPITTSNMYMFVEDGVPTRPAGFFNHNGLYEINIPQASRVEVVRGPGSALYGSEAIAGIIHSMTLASPKTAEAQINAEAGEYGWQRVLVSGGAPITADTGARVDVNWTDNEGYQDNADYERISSTARIDSALNDITTLKFIASYTDVDQSGVSGLQEDDYKHHPTRNYYSPGIAERLVEALRVSGEFAIEPDSHRLYSFIPYYRKNTMDLMPSWMLSYDPVQYTTEFESFGLMSKYRQLLADDTIELIVGLDLDYTPSSYDEKTITLTRRSDDRASHDYNYVTGFATGNLVYDYEADQETASPYIHAEWQATKELRFNAGLRYDYFSVDYDNKLSTVTVLSQTERRLRPESQQLSFNHASPKLGAVYLIDQHRSVYANYRNAFRAPSVNQFFTARSSIGTTELDPTTADSVEIGFKSDASRRANFDIAFYHMKVEDEVVQYIDGNDRKTTNAGKMLYRGIELGVTGEFVKSLRFRTSLNYSKQKYEDFSYIARINNVNTTLNYENNLIGKAPRTLANAALIYSPAFLPSTQIELEWEHVGEYYLDETNTDTYGGHDLFNLRAHYDVVKDLTLYARVMNLADQRYSPLASYQVGSPIDYRVGMPRTAYAGVRYSF
jgi:outer membrane receptor protein involved in Fe transport